MSVKKSLLTFSAGLASAAVLLFPVAASAASIVVTPSNTQGWSTASTASGGAVNFIEDATTPAGVGALELTTNATATSKAQYFHGANTPLSSVAELSYYTKQVTPPGTVADPAYQLTTCLTGAPTATTCPGFTTLVYEPYQNPTQGPIVNNSWQQWDVDNGLFWSTRTVVCSGGTVVGTPGGPASYTLAQLKNLCPSAVVAAYGVNIGSNNPSYNVETDLFNFNGTIYDFEPLVAPPTSKAQCRNNGFKRFNNPSFKNQGECISYVNSHSSPEKVEGTMLLNNPNQKIEFDADTDNDRPNKPNKGSVKYTNFEYPGGLSYEAKVLCVGGDRSLNEARVMFQIPEGYPGLSGQYIVSYVKESTQKGVQDSYGHAATSDKATATAWCETGTGFSPTMYQVRKSDVEVE